MSHISGFRVWGVFIAGIYTPIRTILEDLRAWNWVISTVKLGLDLPVNLVLEV